MDKFLSKSIYYHVGLLLFAGVISIFSVDDSQEMSIPKEEYSEVETVAFTEEEFQKFISKEKNAETDLIEKRKKNLELLEKKIDSAKSEARKIEAKNKAEVSELGKIKQRVGDAKKSLKSIESEISKKKRLSNEVAPVKKANEVARVTSQKKDVGGRINKIKDAPEKFDADKYRSLIMNHVSSRWVKPKTMRKGWSCEFGITHDESGFVISVETGNCRASFDFKESIVKAINLSSPLPVGSFQSMKNQRVILEFAVE